MNAKPYDWPTYHGHIARMTGSNGYGFIAPGGGRKDLFFHYLSVVDNIFDELTEGESVAFEVENGPKGPVATNVRRNGGGDEYIDDLESEAAYSITAEFRIVINDFCKKLAILISKDPEYLRHVEWRDLERIVAEAFSGMGFDVALTPASKDGGKDVVIRFPWNGRKHEYFIEIKHWVSGKKVGLGIVNEFVNVVAKSKIDGGLFLSSSGFNTTVLQCGMEIDRDVVRLGAERKIVSICRRYAYYRSGLLPNPEGLIEIIYEDTE